MRPLKTFKLKRVYRRPVIKFPGKDPSKGVCVLTVTTSHDETLGVINSPLFKDTYIRGFYTPRRVASSYQSGKLTVDRINIYKKTKKQSSAVRTVPDPVQMNGKNLYYDLSSEINFLLSSPRLKEKRKRIQAFADFLTEKIAQVKEIGYTPYVLIETGGVDSTESLQSDVNQPLTLLLWALRYGMLDLEKVKGAELIAHSVPGEAITRVSTASGEALEFIKARALFEILVKMGAGGSLSSEEKLEIETSADSEEAKEHDQNAALSVKAEETIKKALKINHSAVPASPEEEEILDRIRLVLDQNAESDEITDPAALVKKAEEDPEFVKAVQELAVARTVTNQRFKQDKVKEKLAQKQAEAEVTEDGKSVMLSDVVQKAKDVATEPKQFPVETDNKAVQQSVAASLDSAYIEKVMESDQAAIFASFGEGDFPVNVISVERDDTSDDMNSMETITIKFAVPGGRVHTMRIQVPTVSPDGFMYLKGSKKQLMKQVIPMPIVKLTSMGEDVVHFTTFYNKTILSRSNGRLSPDSDRLRKFLTSGETGKVKVTTGSAKASNVGSLNSLEYDEISKYALRVKIGTLDVAFDRKEAEKIRDNAGVETPEGYFPIGKDGQKILYSKHDGTIWLGPGKSVTESELSFGWGSIFALLNETMNRVDPMSAEKMVSMSAGKTMCYTQLRVANKRLPLVVFLGYKDGLEDVLERYKVDYVFSASRNGQPIHDRRIKFEDGYLHYQGSLKNDLLVNGLVSTDPKANKFSEYGKKGIGYIDYFKDLGSPRLGKALENFYDYFLDPITKEILAEHGEPTTLTEAMLRCNDLMTDPRSSKKNDMSVYRVRGAEVINHLIYKAVARAISDYRRSGRMDDSASTISIKPDQVIRELLESGLVEDYNGLNPVRDAENMSKVTFKGPGGGKYGHAKGTNEVRAFDESMVGVFGVNSPDDGSVGVVRRLAYNTSVNGVRGYIDVDKDRKNNATNLSTVGELLSPFTARHADPPRQSMQVRQTASHGMPTVEQNKPLVGSGVEKTLAYFVPNDFAFKAAENGKVIKVDKTNEVIIVEYEDGTRGVIDTSNRSSRSPEGFYISTQLTSDLKVGDKFKKGQILAQDENFFKGRGGDVTWSPGVLSRVAFTCMDTTFEDSSVITEGLAQKLGSWVTLRKDVSLSPKTNVGMIAAKGQQIKAGDPLVIFEETFGDEDGSISRMLDKLGSKGEGIEEFAKNVVAAKNSGEVVEVAVYYNRELSEYSDSLRGIIENYTNRVGRKAQMMKSARKDQVAVIPTAEQIPGGKVHGTKFDGVLIEFFIKTLDTFGVGDKITFDKALKSIVAEVIPDGQDPFTKTGRVDAVMSPLSTISRMVVDCYLQLWTNRVLMDLKTKVRDMM